MPAAERGGAGGARAAGSGHQAAAAGARAAEQRGGVVTTAGLRQIVAHLGAGDAGGTALVSVHLPLPELAAFADLMDGSGQSVVLVGLHQLGDSGAARDAVAEVKASLGAGVVPEAVHAMGVAPLMAAALVEIVAGASAEVMLDGERGTGKSVGMALTLPMLAELRARAGYALPLLVLWVHDSLASASAKTVPGLMEPL